jgi:hypothetical protein
VELINPETEESSGVESITETRGERKESSFDSPSFLEESRFSSHSVECKLAAKIVDDVLMTIDESARLGIKATTRENELSEEFPSE